MAASKYYFKYNFPGKKCRFMIVGKTGSGKSSTGNTLLGGHYFEALPDMSGVTQTCQRGSANRHGIDIEVIDTPGLHHPGKELQWAETIVAKCLWCLEEGPNIILLTISCREKPGREEEQIVENLRELLGQDGLKYLVIVFTNADFLKNSIEENLTNLKTKSVMVVPEIASQAGCRYAPLNNLGSPHAKATQVNELLKICEKMVSLNKPEYYIHTMSEYITRTVSDYVNDQCRNLNTTEDTVKWNTKEEILKDVKPPRPVPDDGYTCLLQ